MNRAKLAAHSSVVFALVSACCAQPRDVSERGFDVGEQSVAVTYGSQDSGHPAVVSILTDSVRGESSLLCTGTLVGSRAVLTAAHCLNDVFATPLHIAFGSDARRPTMTRRVSERYVHPDYRPEPLADHDLAVLAVESPVPSSFVAFAHDAPVTDTLVRLVGFGATDSTGASSGKKMMGTARIDEAGTTRFLVTPAPSLTCFHDSGAPAFAGQGESEKLVGVTTSGRSDCAGFSRFMRVDSYWDGFVLPNISLAESLPALPAEPVAIRLGGGCQMKSVGRGALFPTSATSLGLALIASRRRRRTRS
ncbi:MAG TPA: trypsin-like serine protease [Polyangiaceae bacterium]|nr:trypsin-like serine protease [Polyangiaceae bacterium]